jgi:hypothetical protein
MGNDKLHQGKILDEKYQEPNTAYIVEREGHRIISQ